MVADDVHRHGVLALVHLLAGGAEVPPADVHVRVPEVPLGAVLGLERGAAEHAEVPGLAGDALLVEQPPEPPLLVRCKDSRTGFSL